LKCEFIIRAGSLEMLMSVPSNLAPGVSRRLAMAIGFALPLAARAAVADEGESGMHGDDITQLTRRAEATNAAFLRGDMHAWRDLIMPIAADFTLMQPLGGPASHGFDASDEHLAQLARTFTDGEGVLELVQSYATPDMVVLVFVERQRAVIGGLPQQDWSLRVTQVYARREGEWVIVHRHADPLTHQRDMSQTAALARGDVAGS
jgi:ketosteroid isomerase-like protein